jgi:hypothetical protein
VKHTLGSKERGTQIKDQSKDKIILSQENTTMNITTRKDRRMWVLMSVLLVIVIFALLTTFLENMSIRVQAHSGDVFNATCGRPTIDGNVSSVEWTNAVTMTTQMVTGSAPPFTTTLHILNSANYLYMGFTINDDEFSTHAEYLPEGDTFLTIFDNDNSGSVYELNNHVIALSAGDPQYEDRYIYNLPGSNDSDLVGGGTADGQGAASRVGDLNHFEMKFPLCSGDTLDFCLHPSDVVGFRLEYLDAEGDGSFGSSQFFPGSSETDEADIVIGACSTIPDLFIYLPLIRK